MARDLEFALTGWDEAALRMPDIYRIRASPSVFELPVFVDGRPPRGSKKRRRAPYFHPTKGYRGAHKLFRGGSR